MPVTRRRFLQLLGGSIGALVAACTPARDVVTTSSVISATPGSVPDLTTTTTTTTLPPPTDAISVWNEVRQAVRTSPDHLAERAAEVVAGKDPEAIFAFVRDRIRTVPPKPGFSQALNHTIWGTEATLRCGAGTPREQAELLAELYNRAGFDATVVQGRLDPSIDPTGLVGPVDDLVFDPLVDPARVDLWLTVLGVEEVGPFEPFDLDGELSGPIADEVLARLPAGLSAEPFDYVVDLMPLVEVNANGAVLYANPLVPDAVFGEPYADQLNIAPPARSPGDVEVELQVAMSTDPARRRTMARATWPIPSLVGRRVIARFVPEGEPEVTFFTPANQLRAFTGVVALDDPHLAIEDAPENAVIGTTVTIGGDILEASEDGLAVNDLPFGAEPGAESNVASLKLNLSAAAFPLVRLRVGAFDGAGEPVLGVPADAFTIEEDGVGLPFTLRQTRPPSPRVLLLLDTSNSIPPEFRGDDLATLSRRLVEDVLAVHDDAQFLIAGVANGLAGVAHLWTNDPDEVTLEAGRVVGYGSEFMAAAADAHFHSPTVVVLITDGQSTDIEDELVVARPQLAAGPPVISLLVGEPDLLVPQEIADLSGGAVYTPADHDEVISAVLSHLADREIQPLEFEYEAPEDGLPLRTVELRTTTVAAQATYDVPPPVERLQPPAVSGIYLVVRKDGVEIIRTLAGIPVETAKSESVLDADTRLEVRAALFGTAMLSVEGSSPTISAWLDDILTARLTWQPLFDAVASGKAEDRLNAIKAGFKQVPEELMLLHAGFDDPLTFEVSPRMVLLSRRPTWDGRDIKRADILPFTRFATAGLDRAAAFNATVQETARLAAAEAHLYEDATVARLMGRPYEYLPASGVASREGPLADWARVIDLYGQFERLLPADGEPFGMWAVDQNGTLLGILPDGSGGGSSEKAAEAQCKAINQAAALADIGGAWAGLPGAVGAFIALQKAIIKQYIKQAARVAAIGGELPEVSGCGGAGDFPCDVAKDALFGAIPGGRFLGGVDKVVATVTGDDAFNC